MSLPGLLALQRRLVRMPMALAGFAGSLVLLTGIAAASADAAPFAQGPAWTVNSVSIPTVFQPGDKQDVLSLSVINTGDASSNGPITISDVLPHGLTATSVSGADTGDYEISESICSEALSHLPLSCSYGASVAPGDEVHIEVQVEVEAGMPSTPVSNVVTVSGGGAPFVSGSTQIAIGASAVTPGVSSFQIVPSTLQAGAHPDVTTGFAFNAGPSGLAGSIKDAGAALPPGLIGNATAVPRCTMSGVVSANCSAQTFVGVAHVNLFSGTTFEVPIVNIGPYSGEPAAFGFVADSVPVRLDASVRSDGDYGIDVSTANIEDVLAIEGVSLTFWGVPAEHNGPGPSPDAFHLEHFPENLVVPFGGPSGGVTVPLLTNPTRCNSTPSPVGFNVDFWPPASLVGAGPYGAESVPGLSYPAMSGCELLSFEPSITAAPDTSAADTPAGLTTEVKIPQEGLLNPEGLGSADLKDTIVTLPEGVVINPGQAAGLAACQPSQDGIGTTGPPSCPAASKVGEDVITTPLLADKLEGDVYVLQSNPPELKLLLAASADGVNVKQILNVHLNETTGQLTTTVNEIPQVPFTDLKLIFSGGPQAALVTPGACGTYTTTADFTPWDTPLQSEVLSQDAFSIASGPGGSPCPSTPPPFAPSLIAGATTDQAGGYTNFSLLLRNGDGQQHIGALSFTAPQGLTAVLAKVPLCPEPQASQGTCPASSQIGHAVVASGPGPYPLVIPQPGEPPSAVYLTGPYEGAPFGLSISTPVIAGPFNLGTNVVRAKVQVDPRTAQIVITTDPPGSPHAIPTILDGVPTDLRSINTVIDRPEFMINPTNCNSQEFTGTATSTIGGTAPLSSHFGIGSCRELAFTPKLTVSTGAHASKANGASLTFKIAYPKNAVGSQSWINEAKFDLPKQLPSRLTTLQKACLAATFEANPNDCPPHSLIGHAVVHTPVLPVPLEGPVYFVSYGGAQFPEAVLVLKGYGVTIDLHGETFISSKSVTSATFRNTPDVPFESIEVTLPTGPYSEFGTYLPHGSFNLCGQKLIMPTLFKASDGAEIHQNTPVTVTGCPKVHKAKKRKSKHRKKHHGKGKRK